MLIHTIAYEGPRIDDAVALQALPKSVRSLLAQINGFVQFGGGFHLRGVCAVPGWHSIQVAWHGENAFHRHYPTVSVQDIPFAEDCLGDQFFLRGDGVIKLFAETGEIDALNKTFVEFLEHVQADPVQALSLEPLLQFQEQQGELRPGQLLNAYPPFCTDEAKQGVSLAAVPAHERHRFLFDLAARMQGMPDGQQVEVIMGD